MSSFSPLVSVLIPAFNVAPFIDDALRSICNQSLRDIEIIVVDDGSSDETLQRATAYPDPRISVHSNQRNRGVAFCRNRCVALARGAYLAWMDADDVSLVSRLDKQARFLIDHPDVGVVGADVMPMDIRGKSLGLPWAPPALPAPIRWGFFFGTPLVNGTVMARREVYESAEPYDETFRVSEDYEFWLRLSPVIRMANLKEVLLLYRRHPANTTSVEFDVSRNCSIGLAGTALAKVLGRPIEREVVRLLRDPAEVTRVDIESGALEAARRLLDDLERRFDRDGAFSGREMQALRTARAEQRVRLSLNAARVDPRVALSRRAVLRELRPPLLYRTLNSMLARRIRMYARRVRLARLSDAEKGFGAAFR